MASLTDRVAADFMGQFTINFAEYCKPGQWSFWKVLEGRCVRSLDLRLTHYEPPFDSISLSLALSLVERTRRSRVRYKSPSKSHSAARVRRVPNVALVPSVLMAPRRRLVLLLRHQSLCRTTEKKKASSSSSSSPAMSAPEEPVIPVARPVDPTKAIFGSWLCLSWHYACPTAPSPLAHCVTRVSLARSLPRTGVELQELMRRQQHDFPGIPVPVMMFRMINFVSSQGTKEEGIFRLAGVHTRMKELKEMMNAGMCLFSFALLHGTRMVSPPPHQAVEQVRASMSRPSRSTTSRA